MWCGEVVVSGGVCARDFLGKKSIGVSEFDNQIYLRLCTYSTSTAQRGILSLLPYCVPLSLHPPPPGRKKKDVLMILRVGS